MSKNSKVTTSSPIVNFLGEGEMVNVPLEFCLISMKKKHLQIYKTLKLKNLQLIKTRETRKYT